MGLFKCLAWAAGGVAAVVAAPLTGGGSLAILIGAAGTTTVAGAAFGGVAGVAAKKLYDEVTDDTEEKMKHYKNESETNKAGWQQAESKRQKEAEAHKTDMDKLNTNLEKLLKDRESLIEELRKNKFTEKEAEIMFTLAAAAAQADGISSKDELQAASKAISLLCAQPEEALKIGKVIFKQKITIDEVMKKIKRYSNINTIQRLGFVLDLVIYADGYVDVKEQELLDAFNEHARSIGAVV